MKKYLASAAITVLVASPAVAITISEGDFEGSFDDYQVYEFNIDLGGGARFEGAFVGADLNGDRRIGSDTFTDQELLDSNGTPIRFPKEVPLLRGQYIGPEFSLASRGSQDFFFETGVFENPTPSNALSFHLDGDGGFGGGTIIPAPETMTLIFEPDDFGEPYYALAAGEVTAPVIDPLQQLLDETTFATAVLPCEQPVQTPTCSILFIGEEVPFGGQNFSQQEGNNVGGGGEIFLDFDQSLIDFQQISASETRGTVTSGPLGDRLGATEVSAILPDNVNGDGGFEFIVDPDVIEFLQDRVFFIDPDIAVGYTYGIEGALFSAVQAPSEMAVDDEDGYTLSFGGMSVDLLPGQLFTFLTPIAEFIITGISEDLMLDPDNPLAFITGISVSDVTGPVTITQTPITTFVDDGPAPIPLPAGVWLLLAGLGGFAGLRRPVS